jgi:hypothetical protein
MYRSDLSRRLAIVVGLLLMPLARADTDAGETDVPDTDPGDTDARDTDTDAGDTDTDPGGPDTGDDETGRDSSRFDTSLPPPHTECIPWNRSLEGPCPTGYPSDADRDGPNLNPGSALVRPEARGVYTDGQCCYEVQDGLTLGCTGGGGFGCCGCGC